MSLATAAVMAIAAQARRGSPWSGFNEMTHALGRGPRRPRDRFEQPRTILGIGILVGGLALMSGAYEALLRRSPRRRGVISGTLLGVGGYAIDRLLLPRDLVSSFERTLGPVGTFAKYAAIGVAAAAPPR